MSINGDSNNNNERLTFYGERERSFKKKTKNDKKSWDPKELSELNHEILNLKSLGLKNSEVAKILNCSPMSVSLVTNSTLGKEKLMELRGSRDADTLDRSEKIQKLVDLSLNTYLEILADDKPDGVSETQYLNARLRTSDVVIKELSGLAVPKKIEGRFLNAKVDLDRIKEKGRRAAEECGLVINEQ